MCSGFKKGASGRGSAFPRDVVQAKGGTFEHIHFVESFSTSDIVRRVKEKKSMGLDA
jgi:bifunctional ADP-heptose synthase (sugar kinase/adenylyltransferase)